MRVFTLQELSQFNGKNGAPAYIAYQGVVYDVTGSYFFRGGRHWVHHSAGCDLSEEIGQAPHDETMLLRIPKVGILSD